MEGIFFLLETFHLILDKANCLCIIKYMAMLFYYAMSYSLSIISSEDA